MSITLWITGVHNLCLFMSLISRSRLVTHFFLPELKIECCLNIRNSHLKHAVYKICLFFSIFCCSSTLDNLSLTPADSLMFQGSHLFLRRRGREWVGIWEKHLGELCCKGFLYIAESFHSLPQCPFCWQQQHASCCPMGQDSSLQAK